MLSKRGEDRESSSVKIKGGSGHEDFLAKLAQKASIVVSIKTFYFLEQDA